MEWRFVNGGTYVFVHWGLMRDLSDDAGNSPQVIAHEIDRISAAKPQNLSSKASVQIANPCVAV